MGRKNINDYRIVGYEIQTMKTVCEGREKEVVEKVIALVWLGRNNKGEMASFQENEVRLITNTKKEITLKEVEEFYEKLKDLQSPSKIAS